MELAAVGSASFCLGFRLAGVRKTREAESPGDLGAAVRESLHDPDVGIVVMETDDVRKLDAPLRRELEKSVRPTLVAIGIDEDTELRERLKQALGVDLWK